jgi:hypothetical protein
VGWESFRVVAAGIAAVFAAMLIVLPVQRIATGRLAFGRAWGFLLAGAGFGTLAAGLLMLPGEGAQRLVVLGVIGAVAGNLVQGTVGRP